MSLKISVIIPVYKVEKYIATCIKSLLAQTYSNFEAIIIDDGSPDQSIQIAKSLTKNDPRFIYLKQKNQGQSSARNLGLDNVSGDYIAFLDSDDSFDANCFEKCISALSNDRTIDIVLFGFKDISKSNEVVRKTLPNLNQYYSEDDILLSKTTINYAVWNKIYSSRIFTHERFKIGLLYEDKEILPRLLYQKKLYLIKSYLHNYTLRDGSIMHSYNPKSLESYLYIYKSYEDFLKKNNLYNIYINYYEMSYLRFCFFAEFLHIARYSKNFHNDCNYLFNNLDPNIFTLKKIKKYFSLFSAPFLFALTYKISPKLLKPLFQIASLVNRIKS